MPTKQEMIDKIYEVIADKDRGVGCIVLDHSNIRRIITKPLYTESNMGPGLCKVTFTELDYTEEVVCDDQLDSNLFDYSDEGYDNVASMVTLGRPVMIGTVIGWAYDKFGYLFSDEYPSIVGIWNDYSTSIDDQSDECIQYIYSLITQPC